MYFHVVYFPKQILEIRGEIWNDTYLIRFLINVNPYKHGEQNCSVLKIDVFCIIYPFRNDSICRKCAQIQKNFKTDIWNIEFMSGVKST
jgi:hypothetical protein